MVLRIQIQVVQMSSLQPLMLIKCEMNSYCNIQTKSKDPIHSKVKILVKNTNKEIQTDLDLVQCAITQIHLPNNLVKTTLACNFLKNIQENDYTLIVPNNFHIYIYIYINERYSTSKAIPIYYIGSVWIDYFEKQRFENTVLKTTNKRLVKM